MDLILEQEKLSSLNNNNSSSLNNNNNLLNNNNPVKGHLDGSNGERKTPSTTPTKTAPVDGLHENNNHLADGSSPISASPFSETIYEFGRDFENPSHVISEKVQTLASQIYNELQKVITHCHDDEDAVGGLMPLIINVLESLDLALIENQQLQVEYELCKDDNEQLVSAFEKEKTSKKKIEQRLFEFEFSTDEEKQQYQQRIDSLANIVKMLELKSKNATDHSTRLEEKDSETKKEFNKLHERYNELLRSHCDLMERVKIILGNDDPSTPNSSGGGGALPSLNNFLGNGKYSRFTMQDDANSAYTESYQAISSSEPVSIGGDGRSPAVYSNTANLPRAGCWDSEMSYDDTTTIIEDVEELQRADKEKELRDRDHSLSVTENFFGMEKEIENLITENTELLATKNALNIVKDDLIAKVDELQSDLAMCKNEIAQREAVTERLKTRISGLEEELKRNKEDLEETKAKMSAIKEDDEEGVPIAQRKRFTRVEMSRVLMERNSYKEKYFELQDALRWAELSRATKNDDKRSAIWKFFSNFFNPSTLGAAGGVGGPGTSSMARGTSATLPAGASPSGPAIRYSANPTATPALEAMRRRARAQQNGDLVLMMDSDLTSERARAMKNVKAHVIRSGSGDRIQAYGWSITGSSNSSVAEANKSTSAKSSASVPVPIYCRPLGGESELGMKIWSATAVDLTGGEAGFPISNESQAEEAREERKVGSGNDSLADLECEINEALRETSRDSKSDQHYSTFVWICSVSHSKSKVTIVNIRSNPGEVLDSFFIKTHLLCIASVPGAKTNDLLGSVDISLDEGSPELRLTASRKARSSQDGGGTGEVKSSEVKPSKSVTFKEEETEEQQRKSSLDADDITLVSGSSTTTTSISGPLDEGLSAPSRSVTLEKLSEYVAYTQPPSPTPLPGDSVEANAGEDSNEPKRTRPASAASSLPVHSMSTRLPTMWLGGQNGILYVHSGIAQWSHCIATIHLADSILQIIHYRGRVFVALANGQCCIFVRSEQTGEWNFEQYYVLDVGIYSAMSSTNSSPTSSTDSKTTTATATTPATAASTHCQTALYSIRCLEVSKDTVWLGYRNLIFIVNTRTFRVIHSFVAHPRKETYVRQLAALGDGVWCSFRLDSTLRLYSAFKPYQHVQNIDIEPYVSKMVTPKSFNFVRITSLRASNHRLWIGTSNGVILCLPCVRSDAEPDGPTTTTGVTTITAAASGATAVGNNKKVVTTNAATGSLALSTFMPLCDVSTIQLSFHGHKDNVKFFVCTNNLILSGGEGYVDFRISDTEDGASLSKGDRSHLIVWEITS